MTALTPRLIVKGADDAIAFYEAALSAKLLGRFADGDVVVNAMLEVFGATFELAEADENWGNYPPGDRASVILQISVDDADAVGAQLEKNGAEVLIAIADRFYGNRDGRFRDPFGHLWIVSQKIEDLSKDEIGARLEAAKS